MIRHLKALRLVAKCIREAGRDLKQVGSLRGKERAARLGAALDAVRKAQIEIDKVLPDVETEADALVEEVADRLDWRK